MYMYMYMYMYVYVRRHAVFSDGTGPVKARAPCALTCDKYARACKHSTYTSHAVDTLTRYAARRLVEVPAELLLRLLDDPLHRRLAGPQNETRITICLWCCLLLLSCLV